tara:strand:+ start:280 stop:1425 length:1146 start_codon:yes stop_codon:yes gene_type:complete
MYLQTFEKIETESSEETPSDSSEDEEEPFIKQTHFMNMTTMDEYEKNRDKLFTKDILRKRIVIDSHNYYQPENFNTSNFNVVFDFETDAGTSLVTTNYDIYHNVIGFRLIRTTIRTPPYNVNSTNNVIKYKRGSSDTIHTFTINPGVYTMYDLANVFQRYNGALTKNSENTSEQYAIANLAQYGTYSDSGITNGVYNSGSASFITGDNTFTLTFHGGDSSTTASTNSTKGMIFEMEFKSSSEEVTILWDNDNITRGAARLFGFLPKETTSSSQKLFSNRTPDVSSHFVDLAIPQIPNIGCKRNSSGRDIIERIQLDKGHGEYLHYKALSDESQTQHFFAPITLHRLTIQLWAVNNVLYDTNNSDTSFEFEITMVKNKKLLT